LGEFLLKLATGTVVEPYFFVPLLVQFYVLAPVIACFARQRSRALLAIAIVLQLSISGVWYLRMLGFVLPRGLQFVLELDTAFFVRWALFFPLGTVCGFQAGRIGRWLSRYKWFLLVAAIVLGVLSVLETLALNHLQTDVLHRSQEAWLGAYELKLSTTVYAVVATFAVLAFDRKAMRFADLVERIGSRSYGIYLVHPIVIQIVATFLYFTAPWLASQQWLLQSILFLLAVGLPMLLMTVVSRSPGKKFYRYAFS